jgi:putative ABC transport system permease protein
MPATFRDAKNPFGIIAADSNILRVMGHTFTVPAQQVAAFEQLRTGALVGRQLIDRFGWKVGQQINLDAAVAQENGSHSWQFDIVGVIDLQPGQTDDTSVVLVNNSYLDAGRPDPGTAQSYFVVVSDRTLANNVEHEIDYLTSNSSHETRTESMYERSETQRGMAGDVNLVVGSIVSASLFALLISMAALMIQSLRERRAELATLKAMGFTDMQVVAMILLESLVLCMIAAGIGLAVAWTLVRAFNGLGTGVHVSWDVIAVGIILSAFLGTASATVPMWQGRQLQVAQALARR